MVTGLARPFQSERNQSERNNENKTIDSLYMCPIKKVELTSKLFVLISFKYTFLSDPFLYHYFPSPAAASAAAAAWLGGS